MLGENTLLLILMIVGPLMMGYGVLQAIVDVKSKPKKKIASRLRGRSATASADAVKAAMGDLRKQAPTMEGGLGRLLGRLRFTENLQRTCEQANVSWSAPKMLVNLTLVASILLAIVVILKLPILAGLGAALAIYVLPVLYLIHRRKRRLKKLAMQLPDVFELLGQALRAGHSLASGMQLIATELPEPAGTEFGRVFHEQNLGLKVEDALVNLANRMDSLDVRFFVTAVLIQRQTGGDLAEVLDKIGDVIRDRIKLQGTVQALTAEGRLSGYVLLALPCCVFVAMLKINFEYAELLWTHPFGQMMSVSAIVAMLMGWVMIKKIINIKI